MTVVQIAYEVSDVAVARVHAVLEETSQRDVNWSGADFRIERADFTCLPDDDSANAVQLFGRIQAAISGEAG